MAEGVSKNILTKGINKVPQQNCNGSVNDDGSIKTNATGTENINAGSLVTGDGQTPQTGGNTSAQENQPGPDSHGQTECYEEKNKFSENGEGSGTDKATLSEDNRDHSQGRRAGAHVNLSGDPAVLDAGETVGSSQNLRGTYYGDSEQPFSGARSGQLGKPADDPAQTLTKPTSGELPVQLLWTVAAVRTEHREIEVGSLGKQTDRLHAGDPALTGADSAQPSCPEQQGPAAIGTDDITDSAQPSCPEQQGPAAIGTDDITDSAQPSCPEQQGPAAIGTDDITDSAQPSCPEQQGPAAIGTDDITDSAQISRPDQGKPAETGTDDITDSAETYHTGQQGPAVSGTDDITDSAEASHPEQQGPPVPGTDDITDSSQPSHPGQQEPAVTEADDIATSLQPSQAGQREPAVAGADDITNSLQPSHTGQQGPAVTGEDGIANILQPSHPGRQGPAVTGEDGITNSLQPSHPGRQGPAVTGADDITNSLQPSHPGQSMSPAGVEYNQGPPLAQSENVTQPSNDAMPLSRLTDPVRVIENPNCAVSGCRSGEVERGAAEAGSTVDNIGGHQVSDEDPVTRLTCDGCDGSLPGTSANESLPVLRRSVGSDFSMRLLRQAGLLILLCPACQQRSAPDSQIHPGSLILLAVVALRARASNAGAFGIVPAPSPVSPANNPSNAISTSSSASTITIATGTATRPRGHGGVTHPVFGVRLLPGIVLDESPPPASGGHNRQARPFRSGSQAQQDQGLGLLLRLRGEFVAVAAREPDHLLHIVDLTTGDVELDIDEWSEEEEDPPQEFNFADDLDLRFVDGDEGQPEQQEVDQRVHDNGPVIVSDLRDLAEVPGQNLLPELLHMHGLVEHGQSGRGSQCMACHRQTRGSARCVALLFNCHHIACMPCFRRTRPICPICRRHVEYFCRLQGEREVGNEDREEDGDEDSGEGDEDSGEDGDDDTGEDGDEDTGEDGDEDTGEDGDEDTGEDGDDDTGEDGDDDTGEDGDEDTGEDGDEDTGEDGDDDTGEDGDEDTGEDGDEDTGEDGDEDTGEDGDEDTGEDGDDDTGEDGDEDTGEDGDEDTGEDGDEDTGEDGDEDTGEDGDEDTGEEEEDEEPSD